MDPRPQRDAWVRGAATRGAVAVQSGHQSWGNGSPQGWEPLRIRPALRGLPALTSGCGGRGAGPAWPRQADTLALRRGLELQSPRCAASPRHRLYIKTRLRPGPAPAGDRLVHSLSLPFSEARSDRTLRASSTKTKNVELSSTQRRRQTKSELRDREASKFPAPLPILPAWARSSAAHPLPTQLQSGETRRRRS